MNRDFETIIWSAANGVTTITLNRPEVLNAMSPKLFDELEAAIDDAYVNDDTKVVILTGAGRAFSSGGDMKLDVSDNHRKPPFEFRSFIHTRLIRKMVELEKPIIAAVNGLAVGAGADLALACDIRFASENARFGWMYIASGVIPDLGGVYFLPRLAGIGKAKMLTFTGDMIDAVEAEKIGIVDKLVPADRLMPETLEFATRLAKGPSKGIAMTKVAINKALSMDLLSSLDYTTNLQYLLMQTEDHKEGFKSFLEKRKPVFKGK